MKYLLTGLMMVMQVAMNAQTVEVGLYQDNLVVNAVVYCSSGSYSLMSGGTVLTRMEEGDILYLTLVEGKIRVLDADSDYGIMEEIELKASIAEATFRIRPIQPELDSRVYDENLTVKAEGKFLTLVNQVDMDKYVSGVVESEAGPNALKEFYMAQAILCRTYGCSLRPEL